MARWRVRAGGSPGSGPGPVFVPIAAAGLACALGALVYMTERSTGSVALMPAVLALGSGPLFGTLGLWLPSFVHPFAFALISAALRPPGTAPAYGACLGWWAVNVAFEAGQHPRIASGVAVAVRDLGLDGPWSRPLTSYLLRGTFDVGDLVAATLGALTAAALLYAVHPREVRHVH
jgi:hypothetical protein